RLCICLRMNSPATSRVGNGGCPAPTRHTELKRPATKSHRSPRQPHQRVAKLDDLLEKRAKQVVLAIVARLAHRSPRTAIPSRKKTGMHTRLSFILKHEFSSTGCSTRGSRAPRKCTTVWPPNAITPLVWWNPLQFAWLNAEKSS